MIIKQITEIRHSYKKSIFKHQHIDSQLLLVSCALLMSIFFKKKRTPRVGTCGWFTILRDEPLPVLRMSLSPITVEDTWRTVSHQDFKRLKKKKGSVFHGQQFKLITLRLAVEQCKEYCMETAKCELFSSQVPAVSSWSIGISGPGLCISSKCQLILG